MSILLSLIALSLVSAVFFYPVPPQHLPQLQQAATAVLVLLLLVQLFGLLRRKKTATTTPVAAQPVAKPEKAAPAILPQVEVEAQLVQFLGRLQDKGRFVDFVMDDITPYSNDQIGAAARVVHQGCREVLGVMFDIQPVHAGAERENLTLSGDFDVHAYRLVGNVPEQPPYAGVILHRGWKTSRIKLPKLADDAKRAVGREIIAPAEVEIGQG